MNVILNGAKLPKMDTLKKTRRELTEKKKSLYAEYRAAQQEMREAVAVKANIDHLPCLQVSAFPKSPLIYKDGVI